MCKKYLVQILPAHGTYTSSEALQEKISSIAFIGAEKINFESDDSLIGHPAALCSGPACDANQKCKNRQYWV
jgi:hypothetical protein